jgi:hypothetical protein
MPTREILASFWRDWDDLTSEQQRQFRAALAKFVEDLRGGTGVRPSLRVKGVRGTPGVFELTWARDGRATFEYGKSVRTGESHIRWRRIGTHEILREP